MSLHLKDGDSAAFSFDENIHYLFDILKIFHLSFKHDKLIEEPHRHTLSSGEILKKKTRLQRICWIFRDLE